MEQLLPAVLIGLVIQALFLRWVFKIHDRVEMQQSQIKMLILMAKKMGVSKEDIDDAIKPNS